MAVTPEHSDQDEQAREAAAEAQLVAELAALKTAHISRVETDDLVAGVSSEIGRRAVVHTRACALCLARVTAVIEERVLDAQDHLDVEPDPDGGVDWRPVRPYLRSTEPVVRAAAARAVVALSITAPIIIEELERLAADADQLVSAAAAAALQEQDPGTLVAVGRWLKAAFKGLVEPFTVPYPVLGAHAFGAGATGRSAGDDAPEATDKWPYWSPGGALCIDVRDDTGGLVHITISTTNEEIGAAVVRFRLSDATSPDDEAPAEIVLALRKLAGQQKWAGTWVGATTSHDRVVRVLEVDRQS